MSGGGQGSAGRKSCTVAYATPARQHLWKVELLLAATIGEALAAAREMAASDSIGDAAIPWESAAVGVFGQPRSRGDLCSHGDRIEIYRPLPKDPRARRRERVRSERLQAERGRRERRALRSSGTSR